eukprot:1161660-Pelagomonas_calceolata.AAC.1
MTELAVNPFCQQAFNACGGVTWPEVPEMMKVPEIRFEIYTTKKAMSSQINSFFSFFHPLTPCITQQTQPNTEDHTS